MNASTSTEKRESFADISVRLRKNMTASHSGPLRIAREVCEIVDAWDLYKAEAGMSAAEWIRTIEHGFNYADFAIRARAAELLGNESARWDHRAAVWLVNRAESKDSEKLRQALTAVARARTPGAPPLPRDTVARIVKAAWGIQKAPSVHVCEECDPLRKRVAELEAEIAQLKGTVQ